MKAFYKASAIARAAGTYPKRIHRQAAAAHTPRRPQGNRIFYAAPRGLGGKLRAIVGPRYNSARLRGELVRAAAVLGYILLLERKPYWSREACLDQCQREFAPLRKFSTSALRRWFSVAERGGVSALVDRKAGRVGRKKRRPAP